MPEAVCAWGYKRRPTLLGIGGTESLLVIVQIFVAQGHTRDSRDHQFLLGVFNQIHIPNRPVLRPSSDSHKSPFAWTKPKAGSRHSYASIGNRRSTTQRPSKVKLAWLDASKFTSFFLFQRKENIPFGGKVSTLAPDRTPVLASGPPTKRGILGGAACACMSARRPHCHEKAAPYWFVYRSCLSCDGGRESTVVPGSVPNQHRYSPGGGQQ